jgi:UDP-N-acetylenolpyruvoylglucosamine reductase
LELSDEIVARVETKFGIRLEREPVVLGSGGSGIFAGSESSSSL